MPLCDETSRAHAREHAEETLNRRRSQPANQITKERYG